MIATLTICSLLAIGAALEEAYKAACKAAHKALACRSTRKAATWHAYRETIRYPR